MRIQLGDIFLDEVKSQKITYNNKSEKYLLPYLKEYGSEFTNKLTSIYKVAVGLADIVRTKHKIVERRYCLFILVDTLIAKDFFTQFIVWFRLQLMYEDDYVYDNIMKSTYHMIVIKFPENLYSVIEHFKKGEYSKLSTISDVNKYFENHPDTLKVIIKDNNYKIKFAKKLNKLYNAQMNPNDFEGELDFKPRQEEEIFNHHLKR